MAVLSWVSSTARLATFRASGYFVVYQARGPGEGPRPGQAGWESRIDRLLQVVLRSGVAFLLKINCAHDGICVGAQQGFVGINLVLRSAGWNLDVGVHGLGCLLCHGNGFGIPLIFVDIRVVRSLGDDFGDSYEGFRIIAIKAQDFAPHVLGLLGVICILVQAHRVLIEEYAEFAVRKFRGEIVRGFFKSGAVGACGSYFIGVKLWLRLGLRRTLGCGGSSGRLGRARGLTRRRGTRDAGCAPVGAWAHTATLKLNNPRTNAARFMLSPIMQKFGR